MTPHNSKLTVNLFLTGLLAVTLGTIWWLTHQTSPQATAEKMFSTLRCDFISTPCTVKKKSFEIRIEIENTKIISFEPLPFKVTFKGLNAQNVRLNFQGIEMFMGPNTLNLKAQTPHIFTGTHTLPGHSGYSMTWRAILTFSDQGEPQETWFEFELK